MSLYTFHVTIAGIPDLWRRVGVHSEKTLVDLHNAIQGAFNFDNDHLFSFFMSGKAWDKTTEYAIPEGATPWDRITPSERIDNPDEEMLEFLKIYMETPTLADVQWVKELVKQYPDRDAPPPEEDLRRVLSKYLKDVMEQFRTSEGIKWLWPSFFNTWTDIECNIYRDVRQTKLSGLNLKIGQSFLYLFDYGDEWHFKVLLWDIDETAKKTQAAVVHKKGKAPEQYPDWEDLEEDEYPPFLAKWYGESKRPKASPDKAEKKTITEQVDKFIAKKLKAQYATNEEIAEISSKWFRQFVYIRTVDKDGQEKNRIRLEFAGEKRFHLSGLDHKDNWREDFEYVPLPVCFDYILSEEQYKLSTVN